MAGVDHDFDAMLQMLFLIEVDKFKREKLAAEQIWLTPQNYTYELNSHTYRNERHTHTHKNHRQLSCCPTVNIRRHHRCCSFLFRKTIHTKLFPLRCFVFRSFAICFCLVRSLPCWDSLLCVVLFTRCSPYNGRTLTVRLICVETMEMLFDFPFKRFYACFFSCFFNFISGYGRTVDLFTLMAFIPLGKYSFVCCFCAGPSFLFFFPLKTL